MLVCLSLFLVKILISRHVKCISFKLHSSSLAIKSQVLPTNPLLWFALRSWEAASRIPLRISIYQKSPNCDQFGGKSRRFLCFQWLNMQYLNHRPLLWYISNHCILQRHWSICGLVIKLGFLQNYYFTQLYNTNDIYNAVASNR